ncbi:ribosomal protein L15 [Sistotremastrum niveocremeum HHB9708]|uniref:Ribosomal protein L15 n=1 Tax=Sistotremastrum niveocremeum HHB9708 TaxID=1314777 RepID=A0A164QQA0_9AGAM|nr:ribosomal protein L15 [Sistotremastrum niveocremeum HHB9708]
MSAFRVQRSIGLSNISPALGSKKRQKRVGRGQASGYGGTSGRGHKGQNARAGNSKRPLSFEGGQTPLAKRFPKRGFVNQSARTWAPVNLDRIQHWIDRGLLSCSKENPITARELLLSGCVHDVHDGIKLLGAGSEHLRSPIHIVPSRASHSAIKAVEKQGGSVVCTYLNTLALRDTVHGRTDRISAAPTRKTDILWYTRWRNRGYLAPQIVQNMRGSTERLQQLSRTLLKFKTEAYETTK